MFCLFSLFWWSTLSLDNEPEELDLNGLNILNPIKPGINIERVNNLFLKGNYLLQSHKSNASLRFDLRTQTNSFEKNLSEIAEQAPFLYEDLGIEMDSLDDQIYDDQM